MRKKVYIETKFGDEQIIMREKNLVTKLKNGHFDKTQKLKLFPNSRSQILTKLKNRICDKTDKSNLDKT